MTIVRPSWTPLVCPGCGGSLEIFDLGVRECSHCKSKYMMLGDEYPIPGLTRVIDERETEDVKGLYLSSPLHVRWDSPPDVKEEARVMGISIGRVTHPGIRARDFEA